jgi:hypothetical protein
MCFNSLEQPFCYWVDYTFTFTNGTASAGLHYYTVTVPAGATTGTVRYLQPIHWWK